MKKHIMAGFILTAIPVLIFANSPLSFFSNTKNYEIRDTTPEWAIHSNKDIPIVEGKSVMDTIPQVASSDVEESNPENFPTGNFSSGQWINEEEVPSTDTIPIAGESEVLNSTSEILPQKNQIDYSANGNTSENDGANTKAEKLYNNLGYLSSADQFLKKENLSSTEKKKLANSYRLNGMTEDAEYWYAQIINEEGDTEIMLQYAEMLQSNGKCEDAARWYQTYAEKTEDTNRTFIEDCDALQSIPELEGVTIENMKTLNTSTLDFSPIIYQNGIVFSSTRKTTRSTRNTDKWTKGKFSDLFFAEKNEDDFSKPQPMEGLNKKFHDGTATFNQEGDYVIFTRNSKRGKSRNGIRELKLFEAHKENGKWSKPKGLNLNNNEFATCHPTLSLDGKRLYFSSSRPGGYGGMDIYLSRKISGNWTEPENLGPIINTSGNEVFPFLHEDEKLYFSSNGHKGVGGLDIFVAEKTDHADETSWSTRNNLGKPFNSPKDDVGFCIEKNNESGYLASNRKGGKGKDDIYYWKMEGNVLAKTKKKASEKTFCVYNIMNQERLDGVNVSILPGDFKTTNPDLTLSLKPSKYDSNEFVLGIKNQMETIMPDQMMTTDEKGKFQYGMENGQDYYFVLSKKGFGTVQHQTDLHMVNKRNEYCIAMAPRSCMNMKGKVMNEDYNRPVPFAEVEMFNRCTGETIPTRADENGAFEFCVDCDCEFEIVAKKERFQEGMIVFSTIGKTCSEDKMEEALVNLKVLNREEWQNSTAANNQPYGNGNYRNSNSPQQHPFNNNYSNPSQHGYGNNPNEAPVTKEFLMEYFTGNPNSVIRTGQTFTLKNIYYDFDKHNIRSDAGVELDYIANLMMMQPSMEISLTSHTDSRGDNSYNQRLSQRRAEAAHSFLIKKGISPTRIHGVIGNGEEEPVIPCYGGDCSENEHQTNRRTEITVLKI